MSNINNSALYNIGYGLYVVSVNDGNKDTGCIVNTVVQVTSTPLQVAVTVNKANYTHDVIAEKGVMNVNCLSTSAPFSLFTNFGFQSGRDADKFANVSFKRSENGLAVLEKNVNAFMSLSVTQALDLGTHTMFICTVTEADVLSKEESITYAYYHKNVKPKPGQKLEPVKGYICKICGYVYEGEELPADFVCPICKHGAEDFEPNE